MRATQVVCRFIANCSLHNLGHPHSRVMTDWVADPTFPPPKISIYEARQHPWFRFAEGMQVEHLD